MTLVEFVRAYADLFNGPADGGDAAMTGAMYDSIWSLGARARLGATSRARQPAAAGASGTAAASTLAGVAELDAAGATGTFMSTRGATTGAGGATMTTAPTVQVLAARIFAEAACGTCGGSGIGSGSGGGDTCTACRGSGVLGLDSTTLMRRLSVGRPRPQSRMLTDMRTAFLRVAGPSGQISASQCREVLAELGRASGLLRDQVAVDEAVARAKGRTDGDGDGRFTFLEWLALFGCVAGGALRCAMVRTGQRVTNVWGYVCLAVLAATAGTSSVKLPRHPPFQKPPPWFASMQRLRMHAPASMPHTPSSVPPQTRLPTAGGGEFAWPTPGASQISPTVRTHAASAGLT